MRLNLRGGLTGLGGALAGIAARKAEEEQRAQMLARDDARFQQTFDRAGQWRAEDLGMRRDEQLTDAVRSGFQPVRPGEYMAPIAGEPVPQVTRPGGGFVAKPQALGRALVSVGGQRGVFDPTQSEAAVLARANAEADIKRRKDMATFEEGLLRERPTPAEILRGEDGFYAVDRTNPAGGGRRITSTDGAPITPGAAAGGFTPLQERNIAREQAEAELHNRVFSGQGLTRADVQAVVEKYPGAITLPEAEQFARTVAERRLPGSGGGVPREQDPEDAFLQQLTRDLQGGGQDPRSTRRPGNLLGRGSAVAQGSSEEVVQQQGNRQLQGAAPQPRNAAPQASNALARRMAELKREGRTFEEAQEILRGEGLVP